MSLETVAFVGARYEPETSAYYFDFPTLLNRGDPLPEVATGAHTLAISVADGDTSIDVALDASGAASSGDVPSSGGVWVGGNGSGQAWEYIQYSGKTNVSLYSVTLTGCVREPEINREHNGAHTAGAAVKFFWELDTMNGGGFRYSLDLDDTDSVIDWNGDASGWVFPQAALRDRHLFIYATRDVPTEPFLIELVGFLRAPQGEQDYTGAGPWSVALTSASQVINRYTAPGMRRGVMNVARGASVQAVAALGAWWKERGSGDYIDAEPDLGASSAVDSDKKTLFIADAFVGTEPDHYQHSKVDTPTGEKLSLDDPSIRTSNDAYGRATMMPGAMIISEIHHQRAVGQPGGYGYIELTALDDLDLGTGTDLYIATDDHTRFLPFVISPVVTGDKIVICENEDKFRAENPSAEPKQLIDISKGAYSTFFSDLSVAGDTLGLFYEFEAVTSRFYHVVTWGTGGTAEITTLNNPSMYTSDLVFSPALPVATAGQTYHYNYARSSTAADNWDVGNIQTAGYLLGKAWMLLELPPLGLKLAADISDAFTGNVKITDDSGETTAGLALSSGTFDIQIGDEIITASGRTATTINLATRNVGGIQTAHSAGDPIYILQDGIAINALPIRAVRLFRAGTIIPANFTLRTTAASYPPRTPDQAHYAADYEFSASVTGNTAQTATYNFAPTRRVRWLLVEFDAMSESPARPRLNEVEALIDEAYCDEATWLGNGSTASEFAAQLLTNIGYPAAAITAQTTAGSGEHATSSRLAWDVLAAYSEYAGLVSEVTRDSKIVIGSSGYWTGEISIPIQTWTPDNSRRVQPLKAPPAPVSQVKIKWQSRDGASNGVVVFPDSPDETGEVLEMPEQVYDNAAQAQDRAEKAYWRRKYPYTWIVESAQDARDMTPGWMHLLTGWKLHPDMQAVQRLCLVRSVEHFIEQDEETHDLEWRTTVTLEEIERFAE